MIYVTGWMHSAWIRRRVCSVLHGMIVRHTAGRAAFSAGHTRGEQGEARRHCAKKRSGEEK
jgi:hypothetical protein